MENNRIGALQPVQGPISDELEGPIHVVVLRRPAERPYRSGEDACPHAEIPEERVFENLGNVVVNKQVGKCAAKDHIGGEKQQPPGQTRMILKPPVPLFKQSQPHVETYSRECRRAERHLAGPREETQKSRVIITAKTLGAKSLYGRILSQFAERPQRGGLGFARSRLSKLASTSSGQCGPATYGAG